MAFFMAAVIALVALIITPGFLFYFDVTPKLLVLLAGSALIVLRWKPGSRVFSLLLLLNALSLALSTALSRDPALSAFGTSWRRFGLVAYLAVMIFAWAVAARPESTRTILRGVTIAGGLTALYGIIQYLGWDPLLPASAYHIGEGIWTIVRPPGTLGYVSYFATWLLLTTFVSLALASVESSVAWRRLALASSALAALAMALTGTRAAILGLAAGIGWWLYRSGWRFTRRMVAGAAIAFLAITAFYFSPPGWKLRSRTRWFVEDPWGGARPTLWSDSLRMAASRLPAGYGPEVFTASFPQFESKTLARAYPDFASESPHNIFLDALVSQGLPGFAILCALCFLALRKRANAPPWIAAAIVAGIVAQCFTVFTIPTALLFYVSLAIAFQNGAPTRAPAWRIVRLPLAAALSLALLYCAVRYAAADYSLAQVRRSLDTGNLAAAGAQFARYDRWRLPGPGADLWYSRALLGLVQKNPRAAARIFPESAAAGLRAVKDSENPFDAWYNLSQLYAIQNNAPAVEACLKEAIAANPSWFKPHWALAQLFHLEHRAAEAEREAALAADLNGGKHPEVANTLREIREPTALLQR